MKTITPPLREPGFNVLVLLLCLVFVGYEYDVPASAEPTRRVAEQLVGDWIAMGGWMKVRLFDASSYMIFHDGELCRAWHSDGAGSPLVSAQDIDTDKRKFAYLHYPVLADSRRLAQRVVDAKIIPDETRDAAPNKMLFEKRRGNSDLFGEEFLHAKQ